LVFIFFSFIQIQNNYFLFKNTHLCCGTGTIGLTLASRVKKVIGVEMVKEATEDAKQNAILNGFLFFLYSIF